MSVLMLPTIHADKPLCKVQDTGEFDKIDIEFNMNL